MNPRLLNVLLTLAGIMLFAYLLSGAINQEFASGGVLSEREETRRPLGHGASRSESTPVGGIGTALIVENVTYQGRSIHWWARRAVQARKDANARKQVVLRLRGQLERQSADLLAAPTVAIRVVFGAHAAAALRVAWCESKWHTGATNGQYVNLFQMGYNERRTYGWHDAGSPALTAARAAYRYFVASGRDWSPWECKP